MSKYEDLVENYEDALFALLMHDVAEEEGAALIKENQCLQNDPEAAVPEAIDRRCRKTIRKAVTKGKSRRTRRTALRVLNKVAVAAMLAILLFTAALAASPSLRAKTLNLLIEVSERATRLTMESDGEEVPSVEHVESSENPLVFFGYQIPELPDGFEMIQQDGISTAKWIEYMDTNGNRIRIYIDIRATAALHVDTENAQSVEEVQIQDYEGIFVEKDGHTTITWADTDKQTFIEVSGVGVDREVLSELANKIIYIGA